MPQGYLWDVTDYVPTLIDASLTGRGGWIWGSAAMGGDGEAGLLAPYTSGDRLLVQTTNGHLYDVNLSTQAVTDVGAIPRAVQNPIQLRDNVIHFDASQASVPKIITATSSGVNPIGSMNANAPKSKVGVVYKGYVVSGNQPGEADTLRFSKPDPTVAYDTNSFWRMNGTVSALAALRSAIIVFHPGSVERLRGSTPPVTGSPEGDLLQEPLFDRVGCTEPRTVAYWQDNVVFADEHGVHVTDGATIRNLVSQGSLLRYWRLLWGTRLSVCAIAFLDYYVISLITNGTVNLRTESVEPLAAPSSVTLICDMNKRQWFKFSNVYPLAYFASSGSTGMERVWGGMSGTNRLGSIGPCFFPAFTTSVIADADGNPVLPSFDTPWFRLGEEGRKRTRFAYLSYDIRSTGPADTAPLLDLSYIINPQDTSYTAIGSLPPSDASNGYTRYRLPLGRLPYGIAFRARLTRPSTAVRVFDLALDQARVDRGII